MRLLALVGLLNFLLACGGGTVAGPSDPDAGGGASAVCGELARSGSTLDACIATNCCSELVGCAENGDSRAYLNCSLDCAFDGGPLLADGGGPCADVCSAAHPAGAAACTPYLACAEHSCSPRR